MVVVWSVEVRVEETREVEVGARPCLIPALIRAAFDHMAYRLVDVADR